MLLGVSLLSIMDAGVKWLLIREISVIEIIALRGCFITLALLMVIPKRGGWPTLHTRQIKLHTLRTAVGFLAPLCFFMALKFLPLADATAIFFCATFFMTAGSTFFLGEYVGPHRWAAVALGFTGVLLVSSPGSESFQPASLLALVSGAAYAFIILTGRVLVRSDSPFVLVFYFNAMITLIASLLLPFFWSTPSPSVLLMVLLVSTLALGGYFSLTHAFTLAPISAIAPIEYLALVWATLLGYLFWNEIPSITAWQGMALILTAGLYIFWREGRHRPDLVKGEAEN